MFNSVARILVAAAVLLPGRTAFAQEHGALQHYYALARERNPMLSAVAAAAEAATAAVPAAGVPPDPELQLGIMNASLPGLRTDMPGAMAPSIQVMQMLPFPGKLRLSSRIAEQTASMANNAAAEMWWNVRSDVAMAFHELYEADRQLAVMQHTLEWLSQFEQVALARYTTGAGTQSDVLRAGVEAARMKAELERMRAMRHVAMARLNALVDQPSDTPVPRVAYTPQPASLPEPAELEQWAEESRPLVARERAALERARTREALAHREIWPDLNVGLQYGQRASESGTERMASVMLGIRVPVFARARQLPLRHEAAAMVAMSAAELKSVRAAVRARIGELHAELTRTQTLITLYRTEVLPQAEANVTSAFSSYRVGRVDFMTLVDAQMSLNRYSQEHYALLAEYGWRIAELEMVLGRELPSSARTIQEES